MKQRKIIIITVSLLILLSKIALSWRTFSTQPDEGQDTHKEMTQGAINLLKATNKYPDIIKFSNDIKEGSGNWYNDISDDSVLNRLVLELKGMPPGKIHTVPPETVKYEYTVMCQGKWNENITNHYIDEQYQGDENAYWLIGNIAHLTEDMSSAPHAYQIPQGRQVLAPRRDRIDRFP